MSKRTVGFVEGYKALRFLRMGPVFSAVVAAIWFMRGDQITVDD